MAKHQITIIDIAKELGISKSTVSRALTGHLGVSEKTRKDVLELAEKWDYQKNMLAFQLMSSRTYVIGIIVPELMTSFFPKVIQGAQVAAQDAGYSILIGQSNEQYLTEVANVKAMLANRVDGILVSLTKETQNYEHLEIFRRKGIPIVMFNRVCTELKTPKVVLDDYKGATEIMEHLIASGKKRIAHLAGPKNLYSCRKRKEAYLDSLKRHNLPIDPELIIDYDMNLDQVKIFVKYWLDLPNPPDAIFAVNDPPGIEAIQIIKERGLSIPNDIAVAGFSDDNSSQYVEPGLTTIRQPTDDMGRIAVQLLLDMIDKDVSEWKTVYKVLKPELIVRGSSFV
jgi:LacI family transcriptional regulator, repressor for deo operon, udp, cdd, tsx, nupC, and nupG